MRKKDTSKNKDERNVIKLVRKSNELVEARYKLDIWETRVFTKMLTMVHRNDDDFQKYRIYLKDIITDYGLESNKDAYERLRAGGFKLMKKIVKVVRQTDEGPKELYTPIVIGMEKLVDTSTEAAKFIDVSFHPDMTPFLLSLKSRFTTYDVSNILKLPSSYSVRIYELLKQYQKIGWRKFELKELKEIIGVIEEIDINGKKKYKDNYPLYGNFKQRVLNKAQKDLKEYTDIAFTFDPIKKGRAVNALKFYIIANKPSKRIAKEDVKESTEAVEVSYTEEKKERDNVAELHSLVKQWVSKKIVENWLQKYPESQVKKGIKYTLSQLESGKKIANIAGYLQTMVKQENLVDPKEEDRQKQRKIKRAGEKQALLKEQLETSLKMLYLELKEEQERISESIQKEHSTLKFEIVTELDQHRMVDYNHELSLIENLEESAVLRSVYYNKLRERFPEKFVSISEIEQKIKNCKTEIYKVN